MARGPAAVCALAIVPALLTALLAGPATADEFGVLAAPTAEDFIRALTPQTSGRDHGARAAAIGGTRSLGRTPSISFEVKFEFGSDRLTDEAKLVLTELAMAIVSQELSAFRFLIAGHTDAVGPAEYNLLLSERRARAVRDYLISVVDVSPDRLQDVGWGEARPLDAENPESDVNRRVEITNIGGR